ncbi:MAG: hypothetical protein ACRD1H_04480, partial [Vicinamibacterales bacterium]
MPWTPAFAGPRNGGMPRLLIIAAFSVGLPLTLAADVLVLRDGTRVQGELVSVRNGVIEFEERRGSGRGRMLRLDRDEVTHIELATNVGRDDGFTG